MQIRTLKAQKYQQEGLNDCGISVLSYLMAKLGLENDVLEYFLQNGYTFGKNISVYDIEKYLNHKVISCESFKMTLNELDSQNYIILDIEEHHYYLVDGLRDKSVSLFDPKKGRFIEKRKSENAIIGIKYENSSYKIPRKRIWQGTLILGLLTLLSTVLLIILNVGTWFIFDLIDNNLIKDIKIFSFLIIIIVIIIRFVVYLKDKLILYLIKKDLEIVMKNINKQYICNLKKYYGNSNLNMRIEKIYFLFQIKYNIIISNIVNLLVSIIYIWILYKLNLYFAYYLIVFSIFITILGFLYWKVYLKSLEKLLEAETYIKSELHTDKEENTILSIIRYQDELLKMDGYEIKFFNIIQLLEKFVYIYMLIYGFYMIEYSEISTGLLISTLSIASLYQLNITGLVMNINEYVQYIELKKLLKHIIRS